jgi:hypothetical protein
MLTVVYCTREENPKHKEHLIKTSGLHKNVEVIEIINNGESLTTAYNRGLEQASNDIVVFCHDDITLETKQWGKKLLKLYKENEDYSILGVAGTKNMSDSGRWWDDKKAMYGRVKHTHEGKTWLSAYSPDQVNRVEEVLLVDGVFFSVRKSGLKKTFDESVEGFHFYDVTFCFQNRLEGVKVGVHTNIRVNHQSIGMTNDQWEANRVKFAEDYKEHLPVRINETFENRKMKILIGCLNFQGLTGSEISSLELAKALSKANCDVSVISSSVSEKFRLICQRHGVKTYTLQNPPGYKMGDGKWGMNTPQGFQPSRQGMLYRVDDTTFDVIHANHTPITNQLLNLYQECKFVNIVRSEVIPLENPVVNDKIKNYIAIRPSIKDYVVDNFGVPEDKINVIYNLFDKSRFKPDVSLPSGTDKKVTLFVGTMDYLREESIRDLVEKCGNDNKELWLVGKDSNGYAPALAEEHEHVKYFPPTDKIEEFYYKCDETAGIFLGRTTIEGFLCGKPAIIYTVNNNGGIIDSEYQEVPEDLSIFDNDMIVKNVKQSYVEAYNAD